MHEQQLTQASPDGDHGGAFGMNSHCTRSRPRFGLSPLIIGRVWRIGGSETCGLLAVRFRGLACREYPELADAVWVDRELEGNRACGPASPPVLVTVE